MIAWLALAFLAGMAVVSGFRRVMLYAYRHDWFKRPGGTTVDDRLLDGFTYSRLVTFRDRIEAEIARREP